MANKNSVNNKEQDVALVQWSSIKDERNQKSLAHQEFWNLQPEMFEAILKILFHYDPLGICFHELGASEYSLEVNTILPRLKKTLSVDDIRQIVHEEFTRWFGLSENRMADKYESIAKDIWALLQEQK